MCFRHFLAQRTQKSLTWRELAITVWPQANGSCRWITCQGERSAWPHWHSCSLCTGPVTVSPLTLCQGRDQTALPTEDLLITCLYAAYVIKKKKHFFFSQTIQVML